MRILLVLFFSFAFPLFATLQECQRLREILPLIEQDTLVVFNINNVLTLAAQDAGSTPWAEEQIARIMQEKGVSKAHATNLFIPPWHDVLLATDVRLYDPEAEEIVSDLQHKGIKVMALTNRYIEMAYCTHRQLRSVGIDFAKNAPYPEDCVITGIESPAKYIEGIIFNGLINFKGDSLAAFIQQIPFKPKKVIYIEDKPKHLAQVGEKIAALGIPFTGVHFGALSAERQSYRGELAAIQLKFHKDLLDDTSAACITQTEFTQQPAEKNGMSCVDSIEALREDLVPGALVVTELDHVLWNSAGYIGSRDFYESAKNDLKLIEKIYRRAKVTLIEESAPAFFRDCQAVAISYRPQSLLVRTKEQAASFSLEFNAPLSTGIFCTDKEESPIAKLERDVSTMERKPTMILGVVSCPEDLYRLQDMAERLQIHFKGYLFKRDKVLIDKAAIDLQLECLDRLLTNEEAAYLFSSSLIKCMLSANPGYLFRQSMTPLQWFSPL